MLFFDKYSFSDKKLAILTFSIVFMTKNCILLFIYMQLYILFHKYCQRKTKSMLGYKPGYVMR